MTPLTFGQAKPRLAQAYAGAEGLTDSRVLDWANRAQEAIMRELAGPSPDGGKPWTIRGIYVGGVDALNLTTDSGGFFDLPSTHEVALEVEVANSADINSGWLSDLSVSGFLDPDFVNDLIFLDQGLTTGGLRRYFIPDPTQRGTLRVMAKKRYVPATGDASLLCVPNVEALCAMIQALHYREQADDVQLSENFRLIALRSMKAELDGYLLDPTRVSFRKAAYLSDEKNYASNMLGNIRARLARDLPGGFKVSKTQLTNAVNRAVERLIQRTNELRVASRLSVKNGLSLLSYFRLSNPTDTLPYSDWETIRTFVSGSINPEAFPDAEKRAYELLEMREANALEILRHTSYQNQLQTAIAAGQTNTLLYYRSKLQLELADGLKISDAEMNRFINEAQREIIQQRNSLSATELYSDLDGPSVLTAPVLLLDTAQLVYADFEVVRLFVMAQARPDEAADIKAQAYQLIERNLSKEVKGTRHGKWQCLLKTPRYTFGWMRGTVGLGLSERGFAFSDQKVGRMVNDAEYALSLTPNFKGGEGAYDLEADEDGLITLPPDAERIIYADVCGMPLQVRHRSYEYIPIPAGYGVEPNFFATFANWDVVGPLGYRGRAALQDRGHDDAGNRQYYLLGCYLTNFGEVSPGSAGTTVRVVVKRRWQPKVEDEDVMLVQQVNAVRQQVEAEIARVVDNDPAKGNALESLAAVAMDRQLLNEKSGEAMVPRFQMPGRVRGGVRTLYRRR